MSTFEPVALDVNGLFEHMAGSGGLSEGQVEGLFPRVAGILGELELGRQGGGLPFYDLPYDDAGCARAREAAAGLAGRFDTLVVLGIGGSALGTKAVLDAIVRRERSASGIEVLVLDNIDPSTFSETLEGLDLERSAFNVISKSGSTAETMAQFLVVAARLTERFGDKGCCDRLWITTDPENGPLRRLAEDVGIDSLAVPPGVGGRFSVLSAVGLFPLAAAGIDVEALLEGARFADRRCRAMELWNNPAALHAALLYLALSERGAGIHVLMPYSDRLYRLAEWYAQLWAESIGKRYALDGSIVESGQTPVRALGATDQHSQVQLYVEGPRDKVVTFLRVAEHGSDLGIPEAATPLQGLSEASGYLSGHTLGQLLNMEQTATELALAGAGRLSSLIEVPRVDEYALGQLFFLFELQTLVMGGLLGVNALDQPGVEQGKRLTYALAGREGFEDAAQRVKQGLAAKRSALVLR